LNDSKQLKDRAKDSLATAREIRKEDSQSSTRNVLDLGGETDTAPFHPVRYFLDSNSAILDIL
jgi:hypothetical protein